MAHAPAPVKPHDDNKRDTRYDPKHDDKRAVAKTEDEVDPDSEEGLTIGEIQRRNSDKYWANPEEARRKDAEAREAAATAETAKKK